MSDTITVVGNITQPEYRLLPSGVPVLSFRLASTQRRFDKAENRWVDAGTSWYSVSAFRRLADNGRNSLRRGDRVVVSGRLRVRDWETPAKKGVTAEIDADALGHDLTWGVSSFVRAGGGTEESWSLGGPTEDPDSAFPQGAAGDSDGWSMGLDDRSVIPEVITREAAVAPA